jgi:hypothetical protein
MKECAEWSHGRPSRERETEIGTINRSRRASTETKQYENPKNNFRDRGQGYRWRIYGE